MEIINLSEKNSIINRYLAEMRDCDYQKNRLLFRNNIKRIGEYEAFEISKTLDYEAKDVTPDLTDKTLIIADPMLATGISMEMGMKAFITKGNPKHIHVACVLAAPEGIEHIKNTFPEEKTTIWCASIDEGLNEHKYIVPGFGDAGDLCYGNKL